jgi:hypothetical protein
MNELVAEYAAPPAAPSTGARRVLCLPAHDAADELTASMLAQVLEQAGFGVVSFPVMSSFEELLAFLHPEPQDIICVCALPPFAFSPARSVCKQIQMSFPQLRVVVGLWGYAGDREGALLRFTGVGAKDLVTSLSGMLELLKPEASDAVNPAA